MTSLSHRASVFAQAFTSPAARTIAAYALRVTQYAVLALGSLAILLSGIGIGEEIGQGLMTVMGGAALLLLYVGGRQALGILRRIADELATANARASHHEANGAADVARTNGEARTEAAA